MNIIENPKLFYVIQLPDGRFSGKHGYAYSSIMNARRHTLDDAKYVQQTGEKILRLYEIEYKLEEVE